MSETVPKALENMFYITSGDILMLRDMLSTIGSDATELDVDQLRCSVEVANRFVATLG